MIRAIILSLILAFASVPAVSAQHPARAAFARPDRIVFPARAPYSLQIATLGKMLFFDPRISGAQNMSCATCHNPSFGWETPAPRAIGALNVPLRRRAPSVENLAEAPHLFLDGRAPNLEHQASIPITNPQEMNSSLAEVVARFSAITGYREWFERLFPGEGLSEETLIRSIATYERTLRSGWAPFDDWVEGQDDAISEAAVRGFELFVGKARCVSCHHGWAFTDHAFHDIGLETDDLGRGAIETSDPAMRHAFKTPGLRNITLRAPYMHHGRLATLEDVIVHYVEGGIERPSRAPELASIDLSAAETQDLIAFLTTLTAYDTHVAAPALPAE